MFINLQTIENKMKRHQKGKEHTNEKKKFETSISFHINELMFIDILLMYIPTTFILYTKKNERRKQQWQHWVCVDNSMGQFSYFK